eukprot:TRINITY_DN1723_c0_g2_i1.p1 TRINITY_DN1723_c0_g2~~TRINITY_DN1723_c0_g2_i1.p1  ORF type:complete len:302 (-),score=118.27 TRINITY_DN1723_c0_g2_i1:184-1032(-)
MGTTTVNEQQKETKRIRTINLTNERKRKHEEEITKHRLKMENEMQNWEKEKEAQLRKIRTKEHALEKSKGTIDSLREKCLSQESEIVSLVKQLRAQEVANRSLLAEKQKKRSKLNDQQRTLKQTETELRKNEEEILQQQKKLKAAKKKFEEECHRRRLQHSKFEKQLDKERIKFDSQKQEWKADVLKERLLAEDDKKEIEKLRAKLKEEQGLYAKFKSQQEDRALEHTSSIEATQIDLRKERARLQNWEERLNRRKEEVEDGAAKNAEIMLRLTKKQEALAN